MHKAALSVLLAGASTASAALQVDFGSSSSTRAAAKDVAFDVMSYYKGNRTGGIVGLLDTPPPAGEFYWWTSAILWSTMIDYWHYTGDGTYNAVAVEGLTAQNGGDRSAPFLPANWTASAGNDDHGFWGMAAMQAAEMNLPSAPEGQPSWIELAKGVFEALAARYAAEEACNGGLRWQILPMNNGYAIKNTISTAVFANLGARLSRYTGNQTYGEWAEKSWTWLSGVGFIDDKFNVFDSADTSTNCTEITKLQWTYASGVLAQAAAYMYNHTTDTAQTTWRTRLTSLTDRTLSVFFPNGTLIERACERSTAALACNVDMRFFKGIALRSLASAALLAPELRETLLSKGLRATAEAAVKTCDGGPNGRACGFRWVDAAKREEAGERKTTGPPEEMNALSAVLSVLVADGGVDRKGLATSETAQPGGEGGSEAGGDGNGGGNGGAAGPGDGGSAGNGDNGNAGASTRVGMGLVLAGLFAALL